MAIILWTGAIKNIRAPQIRIMYLFGYCSDMNQNHAASCHSNVAAESRKPAFCEPLHLCPKISGTRDFLDITRFFVLASLEPQITCIQLHCRANNSLPCTQWANVPAFPAPSRSIIWFSKSQRLSTSRCKISRPDKKSRQFLAVP